MVDNDHQAAGHWGVSLTIMTRILSLCGNLNKGCQKGFLVPADMASLVNINHIGEHPNSWTSWVIWGMLSRGAGYRPTAILRMLDSRRLR